MTYRLSFPADVFDIYKQLPDCARQDLAVCLVDAQEDPIGHSEPYGEDDGIIRTVARGHVTAVIMVGGATSTLTVLAVAYAGE
ncbi:hypothetical protein AMK27_38240 [Streptomyces sp. CB02009]|uniref:hypothetical protein n=1 Tax=Streptomyces sp. CB02009 TaxID=1703938 RepID=UPI00093A2817|nr:hypothetical protein [Streptomyces sp. CB02009]OKJ48615.1 hypothetical protein AMK27_38240 [Streptomyces sp. CB02009]